MSAETSSKEKKGLPDRNILIWQMVELDLLFSSRSFRADTREASLILVNRYGITSLVDSDDIAAEGEEATSRTQESSFSEDEGEEVDLCIWADVDECTVEILSAVGKPSVCATPLAFSPPHYKPTATSDLY